MSFLNFTVARTAYDDESASTDPLSRAFDVSTLKVGLHCQFPAVSMRIVDPGQITLLESTSRALGFDGTTELEFTHPELGSDMVRMRWNGNGTAPGFRQLRAIGGGTDTLVELSRASNTAAKIRNSGGTPWNTAVVQIGDEVFFQRSVTDEFDSPFSATVQGNRFVVVDKGSDYLVVRDSGIVSAESDIPLGASFVDAFRVFSSTGVKVGDKLKFAPTANIRPDNKAYVLDVQEVTDRDIYFINPYGIDEVAIPGESSFVLFERMLNFLAVQASGPVELRIDSPSASGITLHEFESGKSIFMGTVSATSVYAVNNSPHAINVVVHSASF